ncbi:hypothetical protein GCM10027578_15330 [Spirosoma luteolum]
MPSFRRLLRQARANGRRDFLAACASGAQIITTDSYQPSTHVASTYSVQFDGNPYFRANPLFSAAGPRLSADR